MLDKIKDLITKECAKWPQAKLDELCEGNTTRIVINVAPLDDKPVAGVQKYDYTRLIALRIAEATNAATGLTFVSALYHSFKFRGSSAPFLWFGHAFTMSIDEKGPLITIRYREGKAKLEDKALALATCLMGSYDDRSSPEILDSDTHGFGRWVEVEMPGLNYAHAMFHLFKMYGDSDITVVTPQTSITKWNVQPNPLFAMPGEVMLSVSNTRQNPVLVLDFDHD